MNRTQNKKLSPEQQALTDQAKANAHARNREEHAEASDNLVGIRPHNHAKDNPSALAHIEQAPQEVR